MVANEVKIVLPPSISEEEAKILLAIKLYEVGKVSLGQAAKISGYSNRSFMEMLGRDRIPVFAYAAEELVLEVEL
ncbi:MAG: UPF0175 family protein [Chloroflexaceae bacterium]|nr:UPF0175 family protein [Chloroflexaceae bacterium]